MTETKLTNNDIVDLIANDSNFKSILKAYKTKQTQGFKIDFNNDYKNGLVEIIYGITINDKLINILIPIFSSEKTISWNFAYLKTLKSLLPKEYQELEEHELINLIKCPLYYLDKFTGELIFLSLVNLKDWIDNGYKGRNGFSVYFWNDKLPNQYSITKNQLQSEIFVQSLEYYDDKEIKDICALYATKHHSKFANIQDRGAKTVIKNITDGLYAQIKVYLHLKNNGYDVKMDWLDGDDLGIDIKLFIHNTWLNIDVKSTKTADLKISKNRKETDFYAVCEWLKNDVILLGFLHKYDFWKSDIMETSAPEYKNEMYFKSLIDLKKIMVTIDNIYQPYNTYKIKKMKQSTRLFNNQ
jgi:hypothetical protein